MPPQYRVALGSNDEHGLLPLNVVEECCTGIGNNDQCEAKDRCPVQLGGAVQGGQVLSSQLHLQQHLWGIACMCMVVYHFCIILTPHHQSVVWFAKA